MLEEMRWLEYAQRLARERRGVLAASDGALARPLLDAATRGGARALGIDAGEIRAGAWADLVAVDLEAAELAGWTDDTLLEALVLGVGDGVVAATCVGGRWTSGQASPSALSAPSGTRG
jgi:formimidoylglutamate deiminase